MILRPVAMVGNVTVDVMTAVDEMPRFGTLARIAPPAFSFGGPIGNGGMVLSALGVPTIAVGRVGDDGFGRMLVDGLATVMDVSMMVIDPDVGTSTTLVFSAPDGERGFLYAGGAADRFCRADVDLAGLAARAVAHVHLGYATLLPALPPTDLRTMLGEARERGMTTSIDVTWDPSGCWMETVAPVLDQVDLFAPNRAEAEALTGCADPHEAARALLDAGVRDTVVVTLDADGCVVRSRHGEVFDCPSPAVDVVDTTGAGDAFIAGWLAARARGHGLREAIDVACRAGAAAVTTRRACDGVTSWEQIAAPSSR